MLNIFPRAQTDKKFDYRRIVGSYKGIIDSPTAVFNQGTTLILRVDTSETAEPNVVSGDLFADDEDGFLWSFLSTSFTYISDNNELSCSCVVDIVSEPFLDEDHENRVDKLDAADTARIDLDFNLHDDVALKATITRFRTLGSNLIEFPPLSFRLTRMSNWFRTVGVERFRAKSLEETPSLFRADGGTNARAPFGNITVESAFESAGVEIIDRGELEIDDLNLSGDDKKWTAEELHHALVTDGPQSHQREWKVRFLLAGRSALDQDPSGIMFDSGKADRFSRQGVAIFADRILKTMRERELDDAILRRQFLYTAMHEIGHAFNLLHSFEKNLSNVADESARPAAISWMNYPKLYPFGRMGPSIPQSGDESRQTWEASDLGFENFFRVAAQRLGSTGKEASGLLFDSQEVRHLRHAAYQHIVMGGSWALNSDVEDSQELLSDISEFHDVAFSIETSDEADSQGQLIVDALEPINLYLRLANKSDQNLQIPSNLAPGNGAVDVLIGREGHSDGRLFRPVWCACDTSGSTTLVPGERSYAEFSPMFGANGWYMFEPNTYWIQAICRLPDGRTLRSEAKTVRIDPQKPEIRRIYETAFSDSAVGLMIALDGSRASQFESARELFKSLAGDKKLRNNRHRQQLKLIEVLPDMRVWKKLPKTGKTKATVVVPANRRRLAERVLDTLGIASPLDQLNHQRLVSPYKGANLKWTRALVQAAGAIGTDAKVSGRHEEGLREIIGIARVAEQFLATVGASKKANDRIKKVRSYWQKELMAPE